MRTLWIGCLLAGAFVFGCSPENREVIDPECGNGRLDPGENCDTAIASGTGACPTQDDCQSQDPCQTAELRGQDCQTECVLTTITETVDGDGCCPEGGTWETDDDCPKDCQDTCPQEGATSCEEGKLRTCERAASGCLAWSEPVDCPGGFCADASSCGNCEHGCDEAGQTRCSDGQIETCTADAYGCRDWSEPQDCPDGFCQDDTSCGSCEHTCEPAGATSCQDGMLRTCRADAYGCRSWSDPEACPDGFCQDDTSCGVCQHDCDQVGDTLCQDGSLSTCTADENGCRSWGPPEACAEGWCADGATCGVCQHACNQVGDTLCQDGSLNTCVADQNGCRGWSPPEACPDGFCQDDTSCGSCEHTCEPAGATSCQDGMLQTCQADAYGCRSWSTPEACPDGFCQDETTCGVCQHTCDQVGDTLCQNGQLSTCVADENGCRSWGTPEDCPEGWCADSATCGVCQHTCPEVGARLCELGMIQECEQDEHGCRFWGAPEACDGGVCFDEDSCGYCHDDTLACGGVCVECPEHADDVACQDGQCVAVTCEGLYQQVDGNCVPYDREIIDPYTVTWDDHGNVAFVLGPGDIPHVTYYHPGNAQLMYATKNSTGWDSMVVDPETGTGRYHSLAVDESGTPHISYWDEPDATLNYATLDGNTFAIQVVDADADGPHSTIAWGPNTGPHIAYESNNELILARFLEGAWDFIVVDDAWQIGSDPPAVTVKDDIYDGHHFDYWRIAYQARPAYGEPRELRYAYNAFWEPGDEFWDTLHLAAEEIVAPGNVSMARIAGETSCHIACEDSYGTAHMDVITYGGSMDPEPVDHLQVFDAYVPVVRADAGGQAHVAWVYYNWIGGIDVPTTMKYTRKIEDAFHTKTLEAVHDTGFSAYSDVRQHGFDLDADDRPHFVYHHNLDGLVYVRLP